MADTPEITENLLEMYGRNDWIMRLNFRVFLRLSGLGALPRTTRIVDCGCAMGHLILMLRSFGFTTVTGLDASSQMVETARRLTDAPIILCDVLEMDKCLAPGSFDVIVVSDLIHHLSQSKDWDTLLEGCSRVLTNDGLLIIREPWPTFCLNLLYRMSRYKFMQVSFLKARLRSFVEEDELLQHFFSHWPQRYKTLLAAHGFRMTKDLNWLVHRITTCRKVEVNA